MARVIPDTEIQKLIGVVLLDADSGRINPNGIELRLGKLVHFQSTDEDKDIRPGNFLKVIPGESVIIASFETVDFRRETVRKVYPGCDMMAMITPTTTMMREGILQASTKVDSGWYGTLNWGLRNSSVRDFILGYGEPIFKLTLLLLGPGETPELLYGQRPDDKYQNTEGIANSVRTVPANIKRGAIVCSSVDALDPLKQLREAGYPFNHISTELTELHGKFEVVSKDVLLLKDAISDETQKLSAKVEESQKSALERVEALLDRKMFGAIGRVVAALSLMYGAAVFLQGHGLSAESVGALALIAGFGMFGLLHFFHTRPPSL